MPFVILRPQFAPRVLFLFTLAVVFAAWSCFTLSQDAARSACFATADPDCTASTIIRHNPYCLFDPTCVLPKFLGTTNLDGSVRHWQGFRILGDPLLVYGNPMTMLALPNYSFFTATACAGLVALRATVRPLAMRRRMIAVLLMLVLLEAAHWYYSVWRLSELTAYRWFVFDPDTYLILGLLLLPIGLTSWFTFRGSAPAA